jgi:hypothetical protein
MKTTLIEVDIESEEEHLTMMDGSTWFVNPGDLPTVATWLPTSEVSIKRNRDSMFNHDITNTSEHSTVKAMQVS